MARSEFPQGTSAVQGEYLIRIYTTVREGSRVVGSRLAERLGVPASAMTQSFQRMERQGLAVIDQNAGVQLTPEGRSIAESIIRRHYLIERLLVDSLGYNWADADDEAEHMEHTLSSKLEAHLYESLEHPTTCPHGNPFPGSADEQRLLGARKMTDTSVGETIVVWRITEEGEDDLELLHYMHDNEIMPGREALVEGVDLRAGHIRLKIDRNDVTVPTQWAQHVRVSGPVPQ